MAKTAKLTTPEKPSNGVASESRVAGLLAFAKQRKQDSRERLLAAGVAVFCANGYIAVSIEDITSCAGVSRITFYRHFNSKADLAVELFKRAAAAAMPDLMRIAQSQFRDHAVICDWIANLFAADRANRRLLRVFTQATLDEAAFTQRAQELISELICRLGAAIPAFKVQATVPGERRRWLEAWLLLYEILDQSNHAALDSGIATDPLVIQILADRFQAFVTTGQPL